MIEKTLKVKEIPGITRFSPSLKTSGSRWAFTEESNTVPESRYPLG